MNEKQKKLQGRWLEEWAHMDRLAYSSGKAQLRAANEIISHARTVYFDASAMLADEPEESTQDTVERKGSQMNEKQKKLDVKFNQIRAEHDAHHVRYSESTLFDLRDCALTLLADEPEKSLRDYTLAELAELVHDIAKEKGWWDARREWPEIACLIHSEISEAVECYRRGEMAMHVVDGKPEGLVVELADVLIRCLDYSAYLKRYAGDYTVVELVRKPPILMDKTDMLSMLFECHSTISMEVRHNPCIDNIIWDTVSVAHHYGLDLPAAIEAKIHYNATRPYRHGGKKA